jgi:uncharacterized protein
MGRVVLSHLQIDELLRALAQGKEALRVSSDLGLTKELVAVRPEGVRFEGGELLSWDDARSAVKDKRKCFLLEGSELVEIRLFSESTGWVRSLSPTSGAPTMLVSGFPMHRVKDVDPMADTLAKIEAASPIHGRVLDTATGLGYTAIQAAKKADEVITIELDPGSIEIARHNPWSSQLFENKKIKQIIGDAFEEVPKLPAGHFSVIIHDPPTIQLAGDLYSSEFYLELKRVLSRRGRLFHYIGDPNSGHGHKLTQGVMRRLSEAGFAKVERKPEAFGVLAYAGR